MGKLTNILVTSMLAVQLYDRFFGEDTPPTLPARQPGQILTSDQDVFLDITAKYGEEGLKKWQFIQQKIAEHLKENVTAMKALNWLSTATEQQINKLFDNG
jgi:hypothetical protein